MTCAMLSRRGNAWQVFLESAKKKARRQTFGDLLTPQCQILVFACIALELRDHVCFGLTTSAQRQRLLLCLG